MIRHATLTAAVCLMVAPAYAQSAIGAQGFVTFGSTSYAASESFEAVAGTSSQSGWGGGGAVTRLWRGLFVDVAVSQQTFAGERVFVNAGTVYPLDVPLSVKIRPVDVAAGWRFSRGRVSPYAGAGLTRISYKETGDFAATGEDISEGKAGALFLGGIDVSVLRWLHVGGELRYRNVTGVVGTSGVSSVFGDDNIGGVSTALRISLGR